METSKLTQAEIDKAKQIGIGLFVQSHSKFVVTPPVMDKDGFINLLANENSRYVTPSREEARQQIRRYLALEGNK